MYVNALKPKFTLNKLFLTHTFLKKAFILWHAAYFPKEILLKVLAQYY